MKNNIAILKFSKNILRNGVKPVCLWNDEVEQNGNIITENNGIVTVCLFPRKNLLK